MKSNKLIYLFSKNKTDGDGQMRDILGNKGAALAEMCRMGLPIPPGFTLSTDTCNITERSKNGINKSLADIANDIKKAITFLEEVVEKKFGNCQNPLLVSIRSGAKISMPGMMDTILNLGLNDKTVEGLAKISNNPRFAYDSYRRFIQMYATVVMNMENRVFEKIIYYYKESSNIREDHLMPTEVLKQIIEEYKNAIKKYTNDTIPEDPYSQLQKAIEAVFLSWHSQRAKKYRELHNISHFVGTAVNIQTMVFGNLNNNSATGVVFTRNPTNGNNEIFGEFLANAQGEDIVAGIRDAQPINKITKNYQHQILPSMEEIMPKSYEELVQICRKLEQHYKNMQDIEFTIENGKLWILQTRTGKCNIEAGLKIASDMMKEKIMKLEDAICSIDANAMERLLHPIIIADKKHIPILKGLPASPGAVSGRIMLTTQKAEKEAKNNSVILVRTETSPEDISGMSVARGILTVRGGMTSHAAVIARGMGKPCVCGANSLIIDEQNSKIMTRALTLNEGDAITINGSTGEVFSGIILTTTPHLPETFLEMIKITDKIRRIKIRTNAETENDIKAALALGAEGIGLCRTEHMFFAPERIVSMRKMIIAENKESIEESLDELTKYQQQDFEQIFILMHGLPTTIRLLDPPLHEFLPQTDKEIEEFCRLSKNNLHKTKNKVAQLREFNPMLGHRGCRLAITHPEIYAMQARAIFNAMIQCNAKKIPTNVEIMIPFVIDKRELAICLKVINDELTKIEKIHKCQIKCLFGTMIELPRAALCAAEIAELVDFISFGTNDLTQTTMGVSRDDSSTFLQSYLQHGIFEYDPFVSLDQSGVGELIKIAVNSIRKIKPQIKIGICGEHGGDPQSIRFFNKLGLDYISCSPFRIPVAKVASAQAESIK